MAEQQDYKFTHRRPTNELETENTSSPDTKRVLLYGWDTSTLAKVRLAVDASGNVKIDPTGIDGRYLKLDQTTPEKVINGSPQFDEGLTIKNTKRIYLDGL
ncbi:MAG: hypothetical protein WC444_07220 [Candidatus Paceibacterota bacterium]